MVELAILFGLGIPAVVLSYIGFKLKDRHSSLKLLLVSGGLVFLLGMPFTSWMFAKSAGYTEIASYLLGFELAVIVVFIIFVFYQILSYLRATSKVVSGVSKRFDDDEF